MLQTDDIEVKRLKWACRRGMLELDLFLVPFFENKFMDLTTQQKELFKKLLTESDNDIYKWLMGYLSPKSPELEKIVAIISEYKTCNCN